MEGEDISGLSLCLGSVRQENAAGEWSGNIFHWIKLRPQMSRMCLCTLAYFVMNEIRGC